MNWLSPRMTAATSSEPRNEHSGIAQLPVWLRPRPMMATAAPNVEQPVHVPCVAGHAVFHHIVGIASESQQLCNLAPEVDEPFADVDVVGIVVVGADGVLFFLYVIFSCHIFHVFLFPFFIYFYIYIFILFYYE